jgi:hypothetical protein
MTRMPGQFAVITNDYTSTVFRCYEEKLAPVKTTRVSRQFLAEDELIAADHETLPEVAGQAQNLHCRPSLYGFIGRDLKNANAPSWDWLLFSMGGSPLIREREANPNTSEAIKALEWRASILRRFASPGFGDFNWGESVSVIMQGRGAMYFNSVLFSNQFEDKEKSQSAEKAGHSPLPAGLAAHCPAGAVDGLAISSQSTRQGQPSVSPSE